MSSPFVCYPHKDGWGRRLSKGSEIGLFSADPPGSYIIRVLFPDPESKPLTMGLSNEAAASLLTLLMREYNAGHLLEGMSVMEAAAQDAKGEP